MIEILGGFEHISLAQLLLVAGVALFASIVGGVSFYREGRLVREHDSFGCIVPNEP